MASRNLSATFAPAARRPASRVSSIGTLAELLALPAAARAALDVALVNLLCAEQLPGAQDLDVAACLATLDRWAAAVRNYTRDVAHVYRQDPAAYGHHKGFAKLVSMAVLLKRGIGVRYQPTAIGNYDFRDSRDDLLHGLLTRRLGTCTSLPVLCVAIGRRLGYPMHLAIANGHVLCQWVDPDGRRLNFEVSGNNGECSQYDDAHYHRWPRPLTSDDLSTGRYLRPLAANEEIALFLETRGHCLADNRRFSEAREAYEQAHHLAPAWSERENHVYALSLLQVRAALPAGAGGHFGGSGFAHDHVKSISAHVSSFHRQCP